MTVYCLQAALFNLTENEANTFYNQIVNELDRKPTWDVSKAFRGLTPEETFPYTTWCVTGEARYNSRQDLDSVVNRIVLYLNANAPADSWGTVNIHNCSADENTGVTCVPTLAWSK